MIIGIATNHFQATHYLFLHSYTYISISFLIDLLPVTAVLSQTQIRSVNLQHVPRLIACIDPNHTRITKLRHT